MSSLPGLDLQQRRLGPFALHGGFRRRRPAGSSPLPLRPKHHRARIGPRSSSRSSVAPSVTVSSMSASFLWRLHGRACLRAAVPFPARAIHRPAAIRQSSLLRTAAISAITDYQHQDAPSQLPAILTTTEHHPTRFLTALFADAHPPSYCLPDGRPGLYEELTTLRGIKCCP